MAEQIPLQRNRGPHDGIRWQADHTSAIVGIPDSQPRRKVSSTVRTGGRAEGFDTSAFEESTSKTTLVDPLSNWHIDALCFDRRNFQVAIIDYRMGSG